MEVKANEAFDVYRELYYEGGVSSVYLWNLDDGFAGVVLLKKCEFSCSYEHPWARKKKEKGKVPGETEGKSVISEGRRSRVPRGSFFPAETCSLLMSFPTDIAIRTPG